MLEYRPPRKNVIARVLVLILLTLSVASFVTAALLPRLPFLFEALGLLLLLPTIQIVTRYLIVRHLYRIVPFEDGNADFEVYTYIGGDRMQLVCRVGLEEITAARPLTEENRRPPAGMHRYNYCPDIRPREATVLSVTNGDGDCEVLITPDARLLAALTPQKQ